MRKIIIVLVLLVAISVTAEDFYSFEALFDSHRLMNSMKQSDGNLPLGREYKKNNKTIRRYLVYVTPQEYLAGWDAYPQSKKDAAQAAGEDYIDDYEDWDSDIQGVIEAYRAEINTLRTNAGMSEITKGQMKQKIKDKKPKKN